MENENMKLHFSFDGISEISMKPTKNSIFEKEIFLGDLNSPYIYQYQEKNGEYYIPCPPYLSLFEFLNHHKEEEISFTQKMLWIESIIESIKSIHQNNMYHGNLSSKAFFVDEQKQIRLGRIYEMAERNIRLSSIDQLPQYYFSPEIRQNQEDFVRQTKENIIIQQQNDMYAIGVLLYEIFFDDPIRSSQERNKNPSWLLDLLNICRNKDNFNENNLNGELHKFLEKTCEKYIIQYKDTNPNCSIPNGNIPNCSILNGNDPNLDFTNLLKLLIISHKQRIDIVTLANYFAFYKQLYVSIDHQLLNPQNLLFTNENDPIDIIIMNEITINDDFVSLNVLSSYINTFAFLPMFQYQLNQNNVLTFLENGKLYSLFNEDKDKSYDGFYLTSLSDLLQNKMAFAECMKIFSTQKYSTLQYWLISIAGQIMQYNRENLFFSDIEQSIFVRLSNFEPYFHLQLIPTYQTIQKTRENSIQIQSFGDFMEKLLNFFSGNKGYQFQQDENLNSKIQELIKDCKKTQKKSFYLIYKLLENIPICSESNCFAYKSYLVKKETNFNDLCFLNTYLDSTNFPALNKLLQDIVENSLIFSNVTPRKEFIFNLFYMLKTGISYQLHKDLNTNGNNENYNNENNNYVANNNENDDANSNEYTINPYFQFLIDLRNFILYDLTLEITISNIKILLQTDDYDYENMEEVRYISELKNQIQAYNECTKTRPISYDATIDGLDPRSIKSYLTTVQNIRIKQLYHNLTLSVENDQNKELIDDVKKFAKQNKIQYEQNNNDKSITLKFVPELDSK
ncbi:hypothetical protein TRFO_38852 [Tritrichomonas foetus]|uniref:Protein kinase domain-containing protein n=1 Tax=Tritrichomonas foetus TaxID=1144522 RepID=A0A1J4JCG6_9EUKA|nr:hypothetical protein TRFO_38852 [Tritrichomonas foetus]|eukprot:OHS94964.1 hypothetical protein TRFO_38852 [Tritrichomonas foetus]